MGSFPRVESGQLLLLLDADENGHIAQAAVGVDLEAEDTRISVKWWVNKTGANRLSGVQDINGTF